MGVFGRILLELARQDAETEVIMIDATHPLPGTGLTCKL